MTIDHASFEERRYTRQHDRVFHALVQQVCELDTRLRYLEGLLEVRAGDTPPEVRAVVDRSRETSTALSEMISDIGESLEAVVSALDTTNHPAAAPARRSTTPRLETSDDDPSSDRTDDDVVVDLDTERQRKPASWRGPGRQPGWMPVGNT